MPKGYARGMVCDTCGGPVGTRNRLGRCIGCRTAAFKRTIAHLGEPDPATLERILYYQAQAALGLDLFAASPYRRLPGAHNRLGERQTKRTCTSCRVATTHEVKKLAE
jgi:hypothetical protein